MPLISVIVPTLRVGGLDVLFAGLERQRMKDFELVLVDCLYEHRRDLIAQKARSFSFPVKHLPPRDNPFPVNTYQRSVNTGVANASAPISFFTCDYAWLDSRCLEQHAAFYAQNGIGDHAVLAPMHIRGTPALDPSFPATRYGLSNLGDMFSPAGKTATMAQWEVDGVRHDAVKRWVASYVADLDAGSLDKFMWSIFEPEFQLTQDPRSLELLHVETKASQPPGLIHQYFCHLKNDSIPTQALLDINGFDEDFDGCHGWQDSEVADRLAIRAGMKFNLITSCLVHLIDVHHLMIIRQISRPERSNESLMFSKRQSGYSQQINPHLNLADIRRKAIAA